MKAYKDPTCSSSVGRLNNEWREMVFLAIRIREGKLRPWEDESTERQKFTGIYKRLLTDPIEELRPKKHRNSNFTS